MVSKSMWESDEDKATIEEAVNIDIRLTGADMLKYHRDLEQYEYLINTRHIDTVIETGTWHGDSAAWFADRVRRVATVDIRPIMHSQERPNITYLEGRSTSINVLACMDDAARQAQGPVLVSLDSAHDARHVYQELEAYKPFVTVGSFMVVEDTIHHWRPEFRGDDPLVAVRFWMAGRKDWEIMPDKGITMHPHGWLRRVS